MLEYVLAIGSPVVALIGSAIAKYLADRAHEDASSASALSSELVNVERALQSTVNERYRTTDLIAIAGASQGPDQPPLPTDPESRQRVDVAVEALERRLREIEQRFPSQSEVDKIASVNDAILATKIEAIQESMKRLEARLDDRLTKWDVATIVFAILGALGVIVSLIFGIIKFVAS